MRIRALAVKTLTMGMATAALWCVAAAQGQAQRSKSSCPQNPTAAIVFVLDNSAVMHNEGYFELARDGIKTFLESPAFGLDVNPSLSTNGYFEIAVTQFGPLNSATAMTSCDVSQPSTDACEYIPLTQVDDSNVLEVLGAMDRLKHFGHATSELVEMGVRHAGELLAASSACDKHIVLLTGNYYNISDQPFDCPADCLSFDSGICPSTGWTCSTAATCDRSCQIRYFADLARSTGFTLSAIQLGSDYDSEGDNYSGDYCQTPTTPDRTGFLRELTNDDGLGQPCDPAQPMGNYARIEPLRHPFGDPNHVPGTATDIATTISSWLCAWGYTSDSELTPDGIPDICDNCPLVENAGQRDCNNDGVGDVCQSSEACGGDTADDDGDGLCNGLDLCDGGDDCVVTQRRTECGGNCTCDCDNDGNEDACQMAQELAALPGWTYADDDFNGVSDYCDTNPTACYDDPPADCHEDRFASGDDIESYVLGDADGQFGWAQQSLAFSDPPDPAAFQVIEETSDNQALELSIDSTHPDDGSYPWTVRSVTTDLRYECEIEGGSVKPHPMDYVAVEMDLFIDNDLGGTTYDLFIQDPCVEDSEGAVRAHFQFVDCTTKGPSDNDAAIVLVGQPGASTSYCGWDFDDFEEVGHYTPAEWFTFKVVFDNTDGYFENDGECDFNSAANNADACIQEAGQTTWAGKTFSELNRVAYIERGVQVQMQTNNESCHCDLSTEDSDLDHWTWQLLCPNATDCLTCQAQVGATVWQDWVSDKCPGGDPCANNCPIIDCVDNCPGDPTLSGASAEITRNPWQTDSDADGWGDQCDSFGLPEDWDGDGWIGELDNCIRDYNPDQLDSDGDGVGDVCDNCPTMANANQLDSDNDSMGNVCDDCAFDLCEWDADGDEIECEADNCPARDNADQADDDSDCYGNKCDNCRYVNNDQTDSDGDGTGDACDLCPFDASTDTEDGDFDGIGDDCDNCETIYNPDQTDVDHDNIGDACDGDQDPDGDGVVWMFWFWDNCPFVANAGQADADSDWIGDLCDNCPNISNKDQKDNDQDGLGDACDDDDDNDGIDDLIDNCPFAANPGQNDTDGDGFPDACDNCPSDANDDQLDCDHDGVGNVCDVAFVDCNRNDIPDSQDLANCDGAFWCGDQNSNGVPDGCEDCDCDREPDRGPKPVPLREITGPSGPSGPGGGGSENPCDALPPPGVIIGPPVLAPVMKQKDERTRINPRRPHINDSGIRRTQIGPPEPCPNGPCGTGYDCVDVILIDNIVIRPATGGTCND